MEFLVDMTTRVPDGTPDGAVAEVRDREAARSRDLAAHGDLLRLWRPPLRPGEWRTLGLFAADDESRLEDVLASMPLRVWRSDQVTPLFPHPNDPSVPGSPRWADGDTEFLTTFAVGLEQPEPYQQAAGCQRYRPTGLLCSDLCDRLPLSLSPHPNDPAGASD